MELLKLIGLRILFILLGIFTFFLTIPYFVFTLFVTLFLGLPAWLITGSIFGWIPEWLPCIDILWDKLEGLKVDIDIKQIHYDKRKR